MNKNEGIPQTAADVETAWLKLMGKEATCTSDVYKGFFEDGFEAGRTVALQIVENERAAFEAEISKLAKRVEFERYSEYRAAHNNEQFPAPQFEPVEVGDYVLYGVHWGWKMWQARAALATAPVQVQHSDDAAIDRFATTMKAKMAASRAKGRGGWDDPVQCSVEKLAAMLCQHVEKGDPVDIANFAMMVHERQGSAIDVYGALAVFLNSRSLAVPDDAVLKKTLIAIRDRCHGIGIRISDDVEKMAIAALAAPAAQGDALIDTRLADAKAEIKYWKERATAVQGDLRNAISNAIYGQGDMLEDHNGTVEAIYSAIAAKAAS